MPLVSGTRLGPYEILAVIGAGGMGEVYKARDTRLDRRVAIKVLPAALAADPQFRDRFEREARVISSGCALVVTGWADPRVHRGGTFHPGDLGLAARWRPAPARHSSDPIQRGVSGVLARWTLAGLHLG
jgi:hypothetical protein